MPTIRKHIQALNFSVTEVTFLGRFCGWGRGKTVPGFTPLYTFISAFTVSPPFGMPATGALLPDRVYGLVKTGACGRVPWFREVPYAFFRAAEENASRLPHRTPQRVQRFYIPRKIYTTNSNYVLTILNSKQ